MRVVRFTVKLCEKGGVVPFYAFQFFQFFSESHF
jgi:hypothetical protein